MPLLVLMLFGSIQACNMVHLKQGLTTATYEGVLEFAKPEATFSTVQTRIQNLLDARGITATSIQVANGWSSLADIPVGVAVPIEVSADVQPNLVTPILFSPQNSITSRAVVAR